MEQAEELVTAITGAHPSDEQVVARVRGGEVAAFELLMRRYNQRLYRVVRSILTNPADVDDVLQETYVRAFSHLDQFLGRARFSTWLTRIAVNEALHRRRRQARVSELGDRADALPAAEPGPEHGAATAELRALLEASIDRLPEEFRAVFMLRDVEGLSIADTAEALTIPPDTVKTRLHRARRRLQHDLDHAIGASVRDVFSFGAANCDHLVEAVMGRIGETSSGDSGAETVWDWENWARALVVQSPDAIVVADRAGVIRLWNAAATTLFGHPAEEAVGQSLDLIIPESLRARHWAGYDAVMQSGTTRYGTELLKVPALHRDGRRQSIEFRVALLSDARGATVGIAAFLRDVTAAFNERRQLQQRLAELERKPS